MPAFSCQHKLKYLLTQSSVIGGTVYQHSANTFRQQHRFDSTLQIVKDRQPTLSNRTRKHISPKYKKALRPFRLALPCLRVQSTVRGGGERDRTDDPLLAKQVLSQLSYTPAEYLGGSGWIRTNDPRLIKTVL